MASRYLAGIQTNRWSRRKWEELPWKLWFMNELTTRSRCDNKQLRLDQHTSSTTVHNIKLMRLYHIRHIKQEILCHQLSLESQRHCYYSHTCYQHANDTDYKQAETRILFLTCSLKFKLTCTTTKFDHHRWIGYQWFIILKYAFRFHHFWSFKFIHHK